jgi:hypothetical protein
MGKSRSQLDSDTHSAGESKQGRLVNKEVIYRITLLTELLPQLQDTMEASERVFAKARPILREALKCLEYLAKAGLIPTLPVDRYMINENGSREIVTADEAEKARRQWPGDFLLDLPRQTLQIRRGKKKHILRLGTASLHWGVQQVLIVGMSQPGIPFGFHTFSRTDPKGSGIGSVKTLTRYIHEARQAIGDLAYETRYIHKTRVDFNESPSRWGYVFADCWSYLVIATCPSEIAKKSWKSILQAIDVGNSVNTSNL